MTHEPRSTHEPRTTGEPRGTREPSTREPSTREPSAAPSRARRVIDIDVNTDQEGAGRNLSWRAVLAGVTTSLACLVTLSLIAVAIGLGIPDATSDQPFEGLGTGLMIWAVLALAISLFAGGLVTGLFAGRAGLLHGVLVWAAGVLVMVLLTSMAASAALGAAGRVVGAAGSALGQGAQTVGSLAADGLDGATDVIADQFSEVQLDIDTEAEVQEILEGTDVPELQPAYLEDQAQAAQDDVISAGEELLANPEDYDVILDDLASTLTDRAENIASEVDRDAVANSVTANTDLDQAEAEELTDQIVEGVENATTELTEQVENAEATLQDVRADVEQTIEDARQAVEDATDAAARAALWGFFALLIGLAVTAFAAHLGVRWMPAERRNEADVKPASGATATDAKA